MATILNLIPYSTKNLWLAANILDTEYYYTMFLINDEYLLTSTGTYYFTINGTSTKKSGYRQKTLTSVQSQVGTNIQSFKPYDVSGKYSETTRQRTNDSGYSFYAFKSPSESNITLLLVNNNAGVLSDVDSNKTYNIEFTDSNGDYNKETFAIESIGGVKIGVLYNIDIDLDYGVDITKDSTPTPTPTPTLTITNEIANTKASYVITDGKFVITITGDTDGTFDSCNITYIDSDGDSVTYEVPTTGNIGTYSLTTDITSVTISGTFTPKKDATKIDYQLTNCVVTGTKQEYVEDGGEVTATLQANDNAYLTDIHGRYTDVDGDLVVIDGAIDTDKKTGSVKFTFPKGSTSPIVYANAEVIEPVGTNYGAINVYCVTLENLESFSKARFFRFTDTDTQTNEQIDLGVYVNRLKRVFIDIPLSGDDVIKCGNYNTGVTCKAPQTDIITLDFGYLTLTGMNGNAHDYDATIMVFLPFVGFISLDKTYIDKTINLVYKINIVTGNGVAIVSYMGTPVVINNVSVSRDVLYKTGNYTLQTIGGDTFGENSLYGFEPYVIMTYTETQSLTNHSTNVDVLIGDITGLAKFENVNVNVNCLADEQSEIQTLLGAGVIL